MLVTLNWPGMYTSGKRFVVTICSSEGPKHLVDRGAGAQRPGRSLPAFSSRIAYCSRATDSPLKGCGLRSMLMLLFPCKLSLSTTICPTS